MMLGCFLVGALGASPLHAQALSPDSAPLLDVTKPGHVRAVAVPLLTGGTASPDTYVGGLFERVSGQFTRNFTRVNSSGHPDPAWRHDVDGEVRAIASTLNGDVYIGGSFAKVNGVARQRLARFLPDGTLDPNWKVDVVGGAVHVLMTDSVNQRLYVGGAFESFSINGQTHVRRGGIARFNFTSGVAVLDTAWNPAGDVNGVVNAFELDGTNQRVYVGGKFTTMGEMWGYSNLARLSYNTAQGDADFKPIVDGPVLALARSSGNVLTVGGSFATVSGHARANLAQVNINGTITSWNPGADDAVSSVTLSGSRLLVGGAFHQVGGLARRGFARFATVSESTPDTLDLALDAPVHAVRSVSVQGTFRVGGAFSQALGQECAGLLRITSTGAAQACREIARNGEVLAMVPTPDGGWVIGGDFHKVNGEAVPNLARSTPQGVLDTAWQPAPDAPVRALVFAQNELIAGGDFENIGSVARQHLAKFSTAGALVTGWAPSANDSVHALALDGSTHVYAAGAFTQMDSQPRSRVARLQVSGTPVLDATFSQTDLNGAVLALALDVEAGGKLYVGGEFQLPGTWNWLSHLTRLDKVSGANDANWIPFARGRVRALALHKSRNAIYVGGDFNALGNIESWNYLGKVALLGSGGDNQWLMDLYLPDAPVHSLLLEGEEALYVGGGFRYVAGGSQGRVARLKLNSQGRASLDTTWNPGVRLNSGTVYDNTAIVKTIARDSFGTMGVGGQFVHISDQERFGSAFFTGAGTVQLRYLADANGSISGPATQTIPFGGNGLAVTAAPASGYQFDDWSDNRSDNPRTDTNVMTDITVTATFVPVPVTTVQLTYQAGPNGSLSGVTSQTIPLGGNGSAVTAVPATGYQFDGWSDGRSDNPRVDTSVMADITVTASFVPVPVMTVQLNYQAGPNGSLSGVTSQTIPLGGNGSAVTAAPATGYRFDDWSDGRTDNPRTDTNVMANLSATARFAANSYTLGGTVSGLQGSGLVLSSNGQTRAIAANGPFQFATPLPTGTAYAVTVSASPSAPVQTCTVTHGTGTVTGADIDTVQVTCVTQTHPVTLSAGSNGTLALAAGQGFPLHAVPDGQPVRIDVQPAIGYAIDEIQGCSGQLEGFVFTTAAITAPCTVSASFKVAIRSVDVSVSLTADRSAGDADDEVMFTLLVANAGPADSQAAVISAAPVAHLRDMAWQCDAAASTAVCPSPAEGTASLAAVLDIPAGTQVTFVLTATLEGQGGEVASLAAGATPSSQESDGHPENNHATAQVNIRGELLSDGFESP